MQQYFLSEFLLGTDTKKNRNKLTKLDILMFFEFASLKKTINCQERAKTHRLGSNDFYISTGSTFQNNMTRKELE